VDRDGISDVITRLEDQNKDLRKKVMEIKSSDNELKEVRKKEKNIHKQYGREPDKRHEKLKLDLQKQKSVLELKLTDCEKIKKEETKESVNTIDAQIKKINGEIDKNVSEMHEEEGFLTKYETRIELKQGDVKVSKGQDVCPTCGAPIDDVELCAKKEREIAGLEKNVKDSRKRIALKSAVVDGLKKEQSKLLKTYKSTSINGFKSQKVEKIEAEIKAIQESISNIEMDIENIKKGISELNTLKQEIENLEQKILRETEARKGIEEIIGSNEARMAELQVKIRESTGTLTRLGGITDYLEYTKNICRDENIKQFAISAIVPYLNKQTNYYLAESGANFYIKFDNWLEETIEGPGIFNCEYNNLSGGESRSVDLALQFAFLDVARIQAQVFPDILILDELLDSSVDATGLISILNIIKARQKEDDSKIFLVTHRTEISNIEVDNVYMVEKREGFSHIRKM
jgi:DNA repair exonuclease SbcCD ATPase subunit